MPYQAASASAKDTNESNFTQQHDIEMVQT